MATVGGNLLQEKRCWFFRNGFDCYKRGGWTCPCYAVLGDHRFYHAVLGAHRCQAVTPSDLATTLRVLDAAAHVRKADGIYTGVGLDDLYTGPGETLLGTGDVLTEVRLPRTALGRKGSFKKLRLWHGDFAVVSVAATALATGDRASESRFVFGGLGPTPWRAREAEKAFDNGGDPVKALVVELSKVAHPLERNGWKLEAAAGLARQAADELATRLRGRSS